VRASRCHPAPVAGQGVLDPVDDEAVQVLVAPPERGLQHGVQVGEGGGVGDQQPAPDQWADPGQYHPQLVHLPRCGHGVGHPFIVVLGRRGLWRFALIGAGCQRRGGVTSRSSVTSVTASAPGLM